MYQARFMDGGASDFLRFSDGGNSHRGKALIRVPRVVNSAAAERQPGRRRPPAGTSHHRLSPARAQRRRSSNPTSHCLPFLRRQQPQRRVPLLGGPTGISRCAPSSITTRLCRIRRWLIWSAANVSQVTSCLLTSCIPALRSTLDDTDRRENLSFDPETPTGLSRTGFPGFPSGRQFFAKVSYPVRFQPRWSAWKWQSACFLHWGLPPLRRSPSGS